MPDKKTYKEINGTTRVGDFLRKIKGVAPDILNVAGAVTGVDGLRKLWNMIESDKDMPAQVKEIALAELNLDIKEMEEVTKRWETDMTSDSWLSKNIRPLVFGFLVICMFIFVMLDSSIKDFKINPEWIDLLKNLLITFTVAYVGSRGYEKVSKIKK